MHIHIVDPDNILSKTQKTKIRTLARELWSGDDLGFIEHIDTILGKIHYSGQDKTYNELKYDFDKETDSLTLSFHFRDPEIRKKELRARLHKRIAQMKNGRRPPPVDPAEQMYNSIISRLPDNQKNIVPSPTAVRANPDMYRPMLSMLPNQHPMYKYLTLFFPNGSTTSL